MKEQKPLPPRIAKKLLQLFLREELLEEVKGDLKENFDYDLEVRTPFRAKLNYWKQVFLYLRPFALRVPRFVSLLVNWMMVGNHFKVSMRSIVRNKLFSTINIVGLAVSMSVGLLLIAFVSDLVSYDRFNEKGSRIYRITSQAKFRDGYGSKFATTSAKAGNLIREQVSGVEESVMLRSEFAGDANTDGNVVVPLTGMYAEPSVLKIFSLPMLKGNTTTMLRKPYSIVLTETSAKKLFGADEALGKIIHFDSVDYEVTGILKDVPFFSHLQFEALVSFSTIEAQLARDPEYVKWSSVWQRNYVYLVLGENANANDVQSQINSICGAENKMDKEAQVDLMLLPLYDIMLSEDLQNSLRPAMPGAVLWIVSGLALVVILSACFNYTNLSIARSMRRFKEVGLRKVIGAGHRQVRQLFLVEAVIVSLVALLLSFGMFFLLRPQFMTIAPELLKMVKLEIAARTVLMFIAFAMLIGIIAGFLPAIFFSKISAMKALRDVSAVKAFRGLSFRRALVVVQYTLTLIFITGTFIGYVQYKNILTFDLGFNTENILNLDLQGNKPEVLIDQLEALAEVTGVSQSKILTSVGNAWGGFVKYKDMRDSVLVFTNIIDENYIPLHGYQLVAGQNFITRPLTKEATSEIIVNEKTLRLFNIAQGDSEKAVGEEILLSGHLQAGKRLMIVGVIRDFHYGKLNEDIKPVAFTYLTPDYFIRHDKRDGLLNVRLDTSDPTASMARIEEVWKRVDPIHPFKGRFYDDSIEDAYSELSAMIKVIGFLSFIAISIASLGLLGMVVFTTETRLKEMGIRKALGANSIGLVVLLSRGFLILLSVSALIALPVTWLFFENAVLTHFPFHEPIGVSELFGGLLAVFAIAFIMIGSQTLKAASNNPAEILRSE